MVVQDDMPLDCHAFPFNFYHKPATILISLVGISMSVCQCYVYVMIRMMYKFYSLLYV